MSIRPICLFSEVSLSLKDVTNPLTISVTLEKIPSNFTAQILYLCSLEASSSVIVFEIKRHMNDGAEPISVKNINVNFYFKAFNER